MSDKEMFDLDTADTDELYEDINNLYLKYYDRYINREEHPVRVKGSVIMAIMDAAEKLNLLLMKNELDKILRRLRGEDE